MSDDEKIELIQQRLKNTKFSQQYTNAPKISLGYILDMETLLELYHKQKEKIKNTGKLVKNKIDGKIGIVLREWETGQIQVLEKIQPQVINTHDSWKTLEVIEDE